MPATSQLARILELSRQRRRKFAKLPDEQKRQVATKELRSLGMLTKGGQLAPAFR